MEEGNSLADVMQILNNYVGGSKDNFNALWSSSEAAGAGFIIADENGKVFQETLEGMGNSAGKCDEAFNIVSDTSEYKFKKALNELRNSFVKAGESLLPLMDGLSEGVETLSDFIKWLNKINPEIVTTIAKFGALSLAGGTLMKVFGSVLIPIGKTVKGFAELSDVMVKVAYGNVPVEKAFSTIGAEATKLVGGFVKLVNVFNPVTLGVGAVVTAIAGLGVAFYNSQKDIEESEQKLKDMGVGLDDFTGRVRDDGNIISQIFGQKLSWNISDDYKQRLEESKAKVEDWVEYIKGLQEEIQGVLNDTEKTDYQKNAEVDELLGTGQKYTGVVNAESQAGYMTYLKDKGFSDDAVKSYVNSWKEAYAQDCENFNKNQDEIQAIYESDMQNYGKLTDEGLARITELQEENATLQTNIESTKYEDLDAMAQKHLLEVKKSEEEIRKARSEGLDDTLNKERQRVNEKYDLMREDVENRKWANEEEKRNTLDNISEMQKAEIDRTNFIQTQNLLRAEYDKNYADMYGLTVEEMVTDNNHFATIIKDANGKIVSSYFSTSEQMKGWAEDMGYFYQQIEADNGQLVEVVMDANGNIIGSVDNLANKYNINCTAIENALSKYQGTTSQKMEQVQRDLDAGIIKAEEYGMTDQEFLKVAQACFESGGDVKTLIDLLYRIPTERNTQVNVNVSDAIANLNYLKQVAEETNTKIAGVNSPGGMIAPDAYATGGIVDESGIATVNEAGWELVDTANSTASAYSLGRVAEGELAYLSANTKVTNHLTSTQQMRAEVNEQVNRAMSSVIGDMKREIIEALKSNSNSGNNYYDIDLNNPNFVNPNDAKTKLDELSKMILRTKK